MRTIYIYGQNNKLQMDEFGPFVMAIGYFDGVHYGHQKVIKTAVEKANKLNVKTAVMTFTPHPKEVISHGKETVEQLTTFSQKEAYIKELGVDYLFVVHFNRSFASLSPKQFVQQYIVNLSVKHVVVGFDFTYGAFGKGNVFRLENDGKNAYSVSVIHKIALEDEKISSTLIRSLIRAGRVAVVPQFLGKTYETIGYVHDVNGSVVTVKQTGNMLPATGTYECNVKFARLKTKVNVCCHDEINKLSFHLKEKTELIERNERLIIEWIANSEQTWYDKSIDFNEQRVTT